MVRAQNLTRDFDGELEFGTHGNVVFSVKENAPS
jgi:hypothetical protein